MLHDRGAVASGADAHQVERPPRYSSKGGDEVGELRWKIQPQRSSSAALVHRWDCALYPVEGGFLNREEAVIAMTEPDIEACQICRPETGFVDG
ncbi:DUF6233 domain-containing protein [Streptomyces sp. NPDC102437]|uniref:DUF6233 domain-containing protein n=1 Tax=Streptomyces sp. NPDC102437 TaxID=3366175 RepID=UPI0037F5779D